ncbi:hypothetical protein E2562_030600 [Oryza meyeriana var. granulata]|uniref:Reverse transcriptase/retrotransposon-derived protein RNase H-like domain-containing protein n=1 Tax=Oryza meyeriana var. granulata TaxID=110450 RepID=A0A6G1ERE2_9ORYZ|nr:hypothetical protein E2562_030600 [Oryza meyeriana var. granulata]
MADDAASIAYFVEDMLKELLLGQQELRDQLACTNRHVDDAIAHQQQALNAALGHGETGTTSGHIISAASIAMDDKVRAVADWPTPSSPRAIRAFLGLASYYHKFIHGFGELAAPLTRLLKKEAFAWGIGGMSSAFRMGQQLELGHWEGVAA